MLAEEPGLPSGGGRGLVPGSPSSRLPQLLSLFSPQTQKWGGGSLAGHVRSFLPSPSGLGLWPRWPLSSHLGAEPGPSPQPPADPGHSCGVGPEALLGRRR